MDSSYASVVYERQLVPIFDLDPDQTPPEQSYINAVVTIVWPYSASDESLALLLAEPDFRHRSRKGQVRVLLKGPTANALADVKLVNGDICLLSLLGAQWIQPSTVQTTPGRSIERDLLFKHKLDLTIDRNGTQLLSIDVDDLCSPKASDQPSDHGSSTVPAPIPSRGRTPKHTDVWSSPAFRRFLDDEEATLGEQDAALFTDDYNRFEEEDGVILGRLSKRTKYSRRSHEWRYVDSSSRSQEDTQSARPPTISNHDGPAKVVPLALDGAFDMAVEEQDHVHERASPPRTSRSSPKVVSSTFSTAHSPSNGKTASPPLLSVTTNNDPLPQASMDDTTTKHAKPFDGKGNEAGRALSLTAPKSPRLRPVQSPSLSMVSPFPGSATANDILQNEARKERSNAKSLPSTLEAVHSGVAEEQEFHAVQESNTTGLSLSALFVPDSGQFGTMAASTPILIDRNLTSTVIDQVEEQYRIDHDVTSDETGATQNAQGDELKSSQIPELNQGDGAETVIEQTDEPTGRETDPSSSQAQISETQRASIPGDAGIRLKVHSPARGREEEPQLSVNQEATTRIFLTQDDKSMITPQNDLSKYLCTFDAEFHPHEATQVRRIKNALNNNQVPENHIDTTQKVVTTPLDPFTPDDSQDFSHLVNQHAVFLQQPQYGQLPLTPQVSDVQSKHINEQETASHHQPSAMHDHDNIFTPRSLQITESDIPSSLSKWFTPRRSSSFRKPQRGSDRRHSFGHDFHVAPVENNSLGALNLPADFAGLPTIDDIHSGKTHNTVKMQTGLTTPLSYYAPLTSLEVYLIATSPDGPVTIDTFAVVTSPSSKPVKARSGPKDHSTTLHITDHSLYPEVTQCQCFRPFQKFLPEADIGDIIILRNVIVRSRHRKCLLLSTSDSAWYVWRFGRHRENGAHNYKVQTKHIEGASPVIMELTAIKQLGESKGPPVETGDEEHRHALELHEWFESVKDTASEALKAPSQIRHNGGS